MMGAGVGAHLSKAVALGNGYDQQEAGCHPAT